MTIQTIVILFGLIISLLAVGVRVLSSPDAAQELLIIDKEVEKLEACLFEDEK